jgi:hypothetical protein
MTWLSYRWVFVLQLSVVSSQLSENQLAVAGFFLTTDYRQLLSSFLPET